MRSDDEIVGELACLGYPGFAYYCKRGQEPCDPAELLFDAIDRPDLDARIVEGLPWIPFHFPDLRWDWLIFEAQTRGRQNRLGFVVSLAKSVAERRSMTKLSSTLFAVIGRIDPIRLEMSDTLCKESWPNAQRQAAHQQRSALAAHWDLDTRVIESDLAHLW